MRRQHVVSARVIVWVLAALLLVSVSRAGSESVDRARGQGHGPRPRLEPQPMPKFPPDSDTGNPTLSGAWPEELVRRSAKRLHLKALGRDCVVGQSSESLEVMELDTTSWHCIAQIPFSYDHHFGTPRMYWTTGDLDGDGNDEIVTCQDSLIMRYHWAGGKLRPRRAVFPFLVDQVQIGDVNNDGRNELVFFCEDSIPISHPDFHPYHLCIASWRGARLVRLWDDNTKLGYEVGNMPDFLVCIADLGNRGRNQILVSKCQSDVSPTRFNVLTWNGKAASLELTRSFALHEKLEPVVGRDTFPAPWESGPLRPFVIEDTTWLIGWYWYPQHADGMIAERGFRILRFDGDSLAASLPRFRNLPEVGSLFLDPDGRGTGLLILREPIVAHMRIGGQPPDVLKGSRFRFFRL